MTSSTLLSSMFALTPYRAILLHLLLIGIPYRFGLLPTGWFRGWLVPDTMLGDKCTIFYNTSNNNEEDDNPQSRCTAFEEFAIRDVGVRYSLFYNLAVVVWITMIMRRMRKTTTTTSNAAAGMAFNKILLGCSTGTLLFVLWLQNSYRPPPYRLEFNPEFFLRVIFYHLLAIGISCYIGSSYPKPDDNAANTSTTTTTTTRMKWSIPGQALFWGGVINLFVSVFSFQMLLFEKDGIEKYYNTNTQDGEVIIISAVVRACYALSAFYTALHSVLLLRVRTFLTMRQLRAICLYKFCVNVLLPIVWFPDVNAYVNVDQRLTFSIRAVLLSTYFFGFLWAGQAEGVSRILSSEKVD